MTYIVVRVNCENRNLAHTEQAIIGLCSSLVAAKGTPYEVAEQQNKVFSIYQTEEPTAYREVVEELASDSEGDEGLLNEALSELSNDVQAHAAWQESIAEENRRDEKHGLYEDHEDSSN